MGHLLTEILLLLAAATLAGLGLGWAFFFRAPAVGTAPSGARLARELEETKKGQRAAEARQRELEGLVQEAVDRANRLESAFAAGREEVKRLEAAAAMRDEAMPPPVPKDPLHEAEVSQLRAEISELRAAFGPQGTLPEVPSDADAGLRAELEQALSGQSRLEQYVAELETERERSRQMLAEQEATLDSLTRELTGRSRPANPATKVVGGPQPIKGRTATLSALRAGGGKGVTERLAAIQPNPEDSSPVISVRSVVGRASTLAEGSPPKVENQRPATVRQARIDLVSPRAVGMPPRPPGAEPAGGGDQPSDEATVAVALGDLVSRIERADESPPEASSSSLDEATLALDVFALVNRIDAATDADGVSGDVQGARASSSGFIDNFATIQQQRPSFLEGDDLKILKGVGPVTEIRLREFGIRSWRGLVDLDEAEIGRLADHMKMTVERIRPWLEQARALIASHGPLSKPG